MSLNKQKGNMYGWISHTWNPIGGRCPHQCSYCYMKGLWRSELRLREGFLQDNLADKTIFVGSSTDMWADAVPDEWITAVLERCLEFPKTAFLFQSKNPLRFFDYNFPPETILGTTLESNREYPHSSLAPIPYDRAMTMVPLGERRMISIEPIMDFDLVPFLSLLTAIQPEFVSIGADSKGHKLPEPSGEKIAALVVALEEFTEVKLKSNLSRLRS